MQTVYTLVLALAVAQQPNFAAADDDAAQKTNVTAAPSLIAGLNLPTPLLTAMFTPNGGLQFTTPPINGDGLPPNALLYEDVASLQALKTQLDVFIANVALDLAAVGQAEQATGSYPPLRRNVLAAAAGTLRHASDSAINELSNVATMSMILQATAAPSRSRPGLQSQSTAPPTSSSTTTTTTPRIGPPETEPLPTVIATTTTPWDPHRAANGDNPKTTLTIVVVLVVLLLAVGGLFAFCCIRRSAADSDTLSEQQQQQQQLQQQQQQQPAGGGTQQVNAAYAHPTAGAQSTPAGAGQRPPQTLNGAGASPVVRAPASTQKQKLDSRPSGASLVSAGSSRRGSDSSLLATRESEAARRQPAVVTSPPSTPTSNPGAVSVV